MLRSQPLYIPIAQPGVSLKNEQIPDSIKTRVRRQIQIDDRLQLGHCQIGFIWTLPRWQRLLREAPELRAGGVSLVVRPSEVGANRRDNLLCCRVVQIDDVQEVVNELVEKGPIHLVIPDCQLPLLSKLFQMLSGRSMYL